MRKNYFVFCFFFIIISSFSQNDLCSNAIEITPTTTCDVVVGFFNGATISSTAPSCATSASQDVWYSFVATDKMMGITLFGTSGVSNGFEVYETNCNGSVIICRNANNATGSGESILYNNFTVGVNYLIRVFNAFSATTTNTFSLCVQRYPSPTNDTCADAITLTPNLTCTTTTVNLSGSTLDGQAVTPCSPNPSQDVWYKFVATDQVMSIALSTNATISNGFEVYQNSCSGTRVLCRNVNGNGSGEFFSWSGYIVGETYFIRVLNEFVTPTTTTFSICVQNYPAPVNDLCQNAITIPVNATCTSTTVVMSGATLDGASFASCSPNPSQDVWYKFTATNATLTVTISLTSDISNGFQIYQNGCNGTMVVCRNNNGNGQGETFTYNGYEVGQDYYIRVVNEYSTPLTTSSFNVCVVDTTLQRDEFDLNIIQLYPNPTHDLIYISANQKVDTFELFNSMGQRLKYDDIKPVISLEGYENGIYFLKLIKGTESILKKIIKQ